MKRLKVFTNLKTLVCKRISLKAPDRTNTSHKIYLHLICISILDSYKSKGPFDTFLLKIHLSSNTSKVYG